MARQDFVFQPFIPAPDDPLCLEHQAVMNWIEEASRSLDPVHWYHDVDPKSLATGLALLDSTPDRARLIVLAAVKQARYWDEQCERVRAQADTESERANQHHLHGWQEVWAPRRHAVTLISALMRRTLPLANGDLVTILDWCNSQPFLSSYHAPLGAIVRAAERHSWTQPLDDSLRGALTSFAHGLRSEQSKEERRLGTRVELLLSDGSQPDSTETQEAAPNLPAARTLRPEPSGHSAVLGILKRELGLAERDETEVTTEPEGPDQFPLRADSPLKMEHALLTRLFEKVVETPTYDSPFTRETDEGNRIAAMTPTERGRVLLALGERATAGILIRSELQNHAEWQAKYAAGGSVLPVAAMGFEYEPAELFDFLLFVSVRLRSHESQAYESMLARLLPQVEELAAATLLTDGQCYVLHLVRAALIKGPPLGSPSDEVRRLTKLIGDGAVFYLIPGEVWTDAVNVEFARFQPDTLKAWVALLRHLLNASSARPSEKWLKAAARLADNVGPHEVGSAFLRWLPLVSEGRTIRHIGSFIGDTRSSGDVMADENAICLRGMLWLCSRLPQADELCRAVTHVALSAYKKIPGVGPRAVKVGNAAVYALSQSRSTLALGQLALLKVRVRFGTAQKEIEKAFDAAAQALALPRDQVEEMGVPAYGLQDVGLRTETFAGGEFIARLRVDASNVTLQWSRADGKAQKSVPAKVKNEHKEDLKELQEAAKDIAAMVPAQAERIDSLFLLERKWPCSTWRERYLDHPLVGTIARRLIWIADGQPVLFLDNAFHDVGGKRLEVSDSAQIELWHPIDRPMEETLAWREVLEVRQLTQPFKQAHREIYLLTDAERHTRNYSNRFAAHIVRQHQFNSLCAARGWKNRLRLMVDDELPPATKELPRYGLRAEFWIESVGDTHGVDTNESGAYLRLSTDQVRFYHAGAAENSAHVGGGGYSTQAAGPGDDAINEPVPLNRVPPLVLSEIMRDVDLFVGVASVGNDPNWSDGGPEGRYRTYWQSYSFGELSATAQTRKAVLERLIPRLNIAGRCSLSDRFLIVRGDVRTYKIHLGSGNILMTPNDQYLCIVPGQRQATTSDGSVFLPFEGDLALSIILSKAFLLADDTRITDPVILTQIGRAGRH